MAQVALGRFTIDEGRLILEKAGTSPEYPGLIHSAEHAIILDTEIINGIKEKELPEVAAVDPMSIGMAVSQAPLSMVTSTSRQPL